MSMEVQGVSGIGIELKDSMYTKMAKATGVAAQYIEGNIDTFMSERGIRFAQAGNSFTGNLRWYLVVDDVEYLECVALIPSFIEALSKIGIDITEKDLILIEDYAIY